MTKGHFGDYLRELRKQKNITQLKLSEELGVSVSTIFRIENGSKKPSYTQYHAIMQTLGEYSDDYIIVHMSRDEIKVYRLISQLRSALRDGRREEAQTFLDAVQRLDTELPDEYKQFVMYARVVLARELDNKRAIKQLNKALVLKRAQFNDSKIADYRLTYNEIIILDEVASRFAAGGNPKKAIAYLTAVKQSMDRFYTDEREKSVTYPAILYNLSTLLGKEGLHNDVLDLCREARRLCLVYNNLLILPSIIYNMASAKYFRGDKVGCKKALFEAYVTASVMEDYTLSEIVKNNAKELFGIVFD